MLGMTRPLKVAQNLMPVGRIVGAKVVPGHRRSLLCSSPFPLPNSRFPKPPVHPRHPRVRIKVFGFRGYFPRTNLTHLAPLPSVTPMGIPQPTSRPRLVAKTTSGLRDSISKAGTGGAKLAGTGPDPNQVWNRNRRMYRALIQTKSMLTFQYLQRPSQHPQST